MVSRHPATLPSISSKPLLASPLQILIDSTGLKIMTMTEKHGARARRFWHKLYLAVDASTNMVAASAFTDKDVDDLSQVQPLPLLDQIPGEIMQVITDSAYDGGADISGDRSARRRHHIGDSAGHDGA